MQHPITGNGFGSFWTSRTRTIYDISGGHSGYLDMLIGLGFVGILLISVFILSSSRKAHHELSVDFDWGTLWICCIIMLVVHNIAESSLDSLTNFLTAVILFFTVASTKKVPPSLQE
jgi:hypothetical protein